VWVSGYTVTCISLINYCLRGYCSGCYRSEVYLFVTLVHRRTPPSPTPLSWEVQWKFQIHAFKNGRQLEREELLVTPKNANCIIEHCRPNRCVVQTCCRATISLALTTCSAPTTTRVCRLPLIQHGRQTLPPLAKARSVTASRVVVQGGASSLVVWPCSQQLLPSWRLASPAD